MQFPFGLVIRIPGFPPGGPGSIPGMGKFYWYYVFVKYQLFEHIQYFEKPHVISSSYMTAYHMADH